LLCADFLYNKITEIAILKKRKQRGPMLSLLEKLKEHVCRLFILLLFVLFVNGAAVSFVHAQDDVAKERRLKASEYRSKMMAGWIGQMVGVGWGAPTEFQYVNRTIPDEEVPKWDPGMVNVWNQDDLYVEMTFLRSLEEYGLDVSIRQAGIDFANSKYQVWHANMAGRNNLRNGIAPPDCSHPEFNKHADDIDYQIEADYAGLIAPGLPNTVITLGEKFGRLVNYGDGLYAGQFVGGMYAEAFFEDDLIKIIEAGLACIPAESQYAEMVRDVVKWHGEYPDDWRATWQKINEKYYENPDYRRWSCSGLDGEFNIDAKINGAYIITGMLYANNDLDQAMIISMQCGQDSDCNPSNAAGVLFTAVGYDNLAEKYISELEQDKKFSYTEYNFPALIDVCEKLAREIIVQAGGRIEKNEAGEEVFIIPVKKPQPSEFVTSWEPGPTAGSVFTNDELPQQLCKWYSQLALLLLLVLPFFVLKENRNLKTFLIIIPLISVLVLWELLRGLIYEDFIETFYLDQTFVFSYSIAITLLFLLGERLARINRYISFGVAMVVFAVAGFCATMISNNGFYDGAASIYYKTYGFAALTFLLALVFSSRHCRKRYSKIRFLLFMLLYILVLQTITAFIGLSVVWGADNVINIYLFVLILGISVGVVVYILLLPYWIVAFFSNLFTQRFRILLMLPENTDETIND